MNNIKPLAMSKTIVITSHVINTLRSLPYEERMNVASALAGEMLLGTDPCSDLAPDEDLIYQILRGYVNRDSQRFSEQMR